MKGILIALVAASAVAAAASALAFIGLPYRPLGVEFLQNNPYSPQSMSAPTEENQASPRAPDPTLDGSVMNVDLHILPEAGSTADLGDGVNEVAVWELDFSSVPQFDDFPKESAFKGTAYRSHRAEGPRLVGAELGRRAQSDN